MLAGKPAEKSDFARNIGGSIVGNIEGYAATTLAGNYSANTLLASPPHLKIVCRRWHASSTSRYKTPAVPAKCCQHASGRLVFVFPEGKEGVNIVNNPVLAIGVGIKDLGVAIDPDHSGATV